MKRYLYFLSFVVLLGGLDACKKGSDPEPDPPIVGSWRLDRIRTSGFVAPYTSLNTDNDPASIFGIEDSFNNKSDKTFTGTYRNLDNGRISDYHGTWDFTNNALTQSDSLGNSVTYTLDATKTPNQLLGTVDAARGAFTNPTTSKTDTVSYNLQFIYTKQ